MTTHLRCLKKAFWPHRAPRVYLAVASPACREHGGYLHGNGEQAAAMLGENKDIWVGPERGEGKTGGHCEK